MGKRKPESSSEEKPIAKNQNYTVLARRYRPQRFSDLIGQEHVSQSLMNAIDSNRVAHAYLFTGNRGVGKTSTARILAKALNCEKGPSKKPCNDCEICESISAGDDVDVIEIDGASNRGIDEVREIRQNVQFRPSRCRYKIYIVDEVHMLTGPAFNALLKTLEEPPAHVKFIFATTEAQKIPITILSRCQRFDFAGISVQSIIAQLKRIVESEGMKAEEEALELVARRAGGSMRDAESLLDQLLAFGDDALTVDQVHNILGTAHADRVVELADFIVKQEKGQALSSLQQTSAQGLDLGELLDQLTQYWRDLMIVQCAGVQGQTLSVGSAHHRALQEQARSLSLDTILAGIDILVAAKNKLSRFSHHRNVLVEAAVVRLCQVSDLMPLAQLAEWCKNPKLANAAAGEPTSADTHQAGPPPLSGRLSDSLAPGPPKKKVASDRTGQLAETALHEDSVHEIWSQLLDRLSPMVANELTKIDSLAISGPNTLVICFPASYNFIRNNCQERVDQLEAALRQIVGRPCKVRIETTEDNHSPETADNRSRLSATAGAQSVGDVTGKIGLLQRAKEVLGARELRVDPGFGEDLQNSARTEASSEKQE